MRPRVSRLTRAAPALALSLLAPLAGGCGAPSDQAQRTVLAAVDAALSAPRIFQFVDHDLESTTTVSGRMADDQRYALLLSQQGVTRWELVADGDAVADYFPDPNAVTTFSGAGSGPEVDLAATFAKVRRFFPAKYAGQAETLYAAALPRPKTVPDSLGLAALRAGKWVVDPTGAPKPPTAGNESNQAASSPFYEPMTELALVRQLVASSQPQEVHLWQRGDLTPAFRPGDDPFPAPGPGEARYDLMEPPLPRPGLGTARGLPNPPSNDDFRKTAIYVKAGKVSAIRNVYDILDRLSDVTRRYQLPLTIDATAGAHLEEQLGQVTINLLQGVRSNDPLRVHEETMVLSYPKSVPAITLPSPAVTASLAALPGQGLAGAAPATG